MSSASGTAGTRARSAVIVGAGALGRLIALELAHRHWTVTLVDERGADGAGSASFAAAGMLCPYAEVEEAARPIATLGIASLALWPRLLEKLSRRVPFETSGTLAIAPSRDREELSRLAREVDRRHPGAAEPLDGVALARLEPELDGRFGSGLFFPREGHIDNRELLVALDETLQAARVSRRYGERIERLLPGRAVGARDSLEADWIVDCRGAGARDDLADLRPVRGEILRVEAPEVSLRRPIRFRHPRYPVYIVPRRDHRYVIGATAIESGDTGPVTVRSVLELLSAAYTVHPGFGEARVLEMTAALRPAFADNLPRARLRPGLLRVNGLFRNGFLCAPRVAELAVECLENERPPADEALPFEEAP